MAPEPRVALGDRKLRRPHPASPEATGDRDRRTPVVGPADDVRGERPVMLCVRVAPTLRRRVKLVAASSGRPIQALVTDVLEAICRQHDM